MSTNMRPTLAELNTADLNLPDAVVGGNLALHPRVGPDSPHVGIGQSRGVMPNSKLLSALRDLVSRVVGLGAEEQMIRVDAQAHVASMQHAYPFRDRAVGEFPCYSVGALNAAVESKTAVASAGADSSRPQPAGIGLVNPRPEALLYTFGSHVTSLGSLVRSAVRIPVLPRFAYFTTEGGR